MTADVTGGDGGAGLGYRICWKWPQSPGTKAFADSSAQGQDGYGSFISVQTSATPPVSEQEAPAAPVHSSEASPPSWGCRLGDVAEGQPGSWGGEV